MSDAIFAELADLIVDTARELRIRTGGVARGVPLNQTQSQVMRYVHAHAGCLPSEIASGTGVHRANVSQAISELRDLGYLVTRKHENDGRSILVEPTMHADQTIHRLREAWGDLLEDAWQRSAVVLGDDQGSADLKTTRELLTKAMESLTRSRV